MSLFSDPSWKRAFIWAVLAHVIFLLAPFVLTQYWPLKARSPKIVTIDLFNVEYNTPKVKIKVKKHILKSKKVKKVKKKTVVNPQTVKKKSLVKKVKIQTKTKRPRSYIKKKSKNLVSIHATKLKKNKTVKKQIRKNSTKKLILKKKINKKSVKKSSNRIKYKKKIENFDKIIAKKIRQIQKQLEEKKKEQYLAQQLKQLEEVVQKRAKQRYNQALRNYLARYVYPELHRNWAWPEGLSKEPLECIIIISIDKHGNIIKKWIEKGSGNQLFDQSALRAVEESGPFPPLPPPLQPGPLEIGVRFRPNQIGK